MTMNVSRRSLLALGAGLGASTFLGGSALAKAPKLGTQTPYWHRFILGDAEVTVVSDGTLPPRKVEAPKPAPSASKDRRETFIVIRLPPLFL